MPCPKLIEQIQRPERLFPVEVWKAAYPQTNGTGGLGLAPDGQPLSGKTVVLKLVKDESNSASRQWGQRLQDLGDKAKKVLSPSVAKTLDVGADAGVIYVATEFLDPAAGWKTLDEEAPKNTSLTVEQSVRIVWNVARALEAMEQLGAVHGCITPSKVMVAPVRQAPGFHQVKLRDLGLGHLRVYEDYSAISLQLARYLAPELLDMDQSPDIRSDIYSLGAVFFRILGGWPPVVGDSVNDIFEKKWRAARPPEIRSVRPNVDKNEAPALDDVLGKMLALDPKDRYQTARELTGALEELARSFGIRLEPEKEPIQIWRDNELVVARLGARFPHRCILCNDESGDSRLRRSLHWHPAWLYWFMIFPGLLFYAILAAIVEKTTKVDVGLCPRHRRNQNVALAGVIALLAGGAAALGTAWRVQSLPLAAGGVGLLVAAAMVDLGIRTLLSARNIESQRVWISGAGRKFLESLPDYDGRDS